MTAAGGERPFDFEAYAAAVEGKDAAAWAEFFVEDAVWLEYRGRNPPRSPNVIAGRTAIREFLEQVAAAPFRLEVSHPVVSPERAAYRAWITFADDRQIIEHVILELADGRIVRQVDVEAWD